MIMLVDIFEQRVQRPRQRAEADTCYSGKKKMHTLKSQVTVDGRSRQIIDVASSVRGPTADITVLKKSRRAGTFGGADGAVWQSGLCELAGGAFGRAGDHAAPQAAWTASLTPGSA